MVECQNPGKSVCKLPNDWKEDVFGVELGTFHSFLAMKLAVSFKFKATGGI